MRLWIVCILLLCPRVLFAADGDLNGACQTKGTWRYCEVLLCDARDMTDGAGNPADCDEFDLLEFSSGKPDLFAVDITADNCTNVNVVDVSVLAISGGVKHVVKDGLTLTATGGTYTFAGNTAPVHRYVQITGSTGGTEGSVGACNAFTVIGRGWWRLR